MYTKDLHVYVRYDTIYSMDETRRQRFKRLATKRVNKTLTQLRIIGNLANKSYYEYSTEDVAKIFKAVDNQLKTTKSKFHITTRKFKL